MTPRGVFFVSFFGACCLWALANPFAGIVAYVVHYHSYPERSWWGGLSAAGFRYSFTITACLTLGTLANLGRLPYGRLINRQEALYLTFISWVVFERQLRGQMTDVDVTDKVLKLAVFVLALTHIVVTPKRYEQFAWLLTCCALYLGFEAYTAPAGAYYNGRLNDIGGPDFADSNALGAHMVCLLAIIGVQFLRGGWRGKLFCLVAGALAANTVVATRSRGAFLAAVVGLVASPILAPKGGRKKLWPLFLLVALGALTLMDSGFISRMGTLGAEEREQDRSSQDRLMTWEASLKMIRDHPLGVGPGNYPAYLGKYLADHEGRDAHNTYLLCAAELGLPGLVLFAILVANAFATSARVSREFSATPGCEEYAWHGFAQRVALVTYLTNGIFGSLIYVEMLWWLLLLPSAFEPAVANARRELTDGGG